MAYSRQKALDDVLGNPGLMDITHHVNFTDMVTWGKEFGLSPVGFCSQWSFLASSGIEKVIKRLFPKGIDPFSPGLAGLKMLLLPQGMGDTHKVLVQCKGLGRNLKLKGFNLLNKLSRIVENK